MSDQLLGEVLRLRADTRRHSGYLARQEIERILEPLRRDPKRLEPFGFKVYSQNDEDGILEEIFRRLVISRGRFVEIGVENGLECNTLYLLHKGWRGLWLEGNTAHRSTIEQTFRTILGTRLKVGFTWVSTDNINALLRSLGVADDVDLVSIDVDGNDVWLFEALDLRPKVVCIEYNAKFPATVSKRPIYDPNARWSGGDYMGASLRALADAASAKGYRLVATNLTGSNAFFVRADLADNLFPDDASPENLQHPPRYWLGRDHYASIGHRAEFGPYVDMIDD